MKGGRMEFFASIRFFHRRSKYKNTGIIFLFLIAAVVLALSLTVSGCAKEKGSQQALRFVTWKPNQPEVWEEIYRIFEQEHPDIRIEREIGPHSSTAFHDLLTQKLKNRSTDVDVFFMDVIWPPEFAAAGWALPLDELFSQDERVQFLEGTILANTYQGHIYGVPLFIDSGVLYYRKDLLQQYGFKVPVTWEELVTQAETIVAEEKKKGNEMYGFSGQFKQYEGLVCDMMEYIMSNGGALVDLSTGKSVITGEKAIEAVRFVRDRIIGNIAPRGVLTYQEPEWSFTETGPMRGRCRIIRQNRGCPARWELHGFLILTATGATLLSGDGSSASAIIRRKKMRHGRLSSSLPVSVRSNCLP